MSKIDLPVRCLIPSKIIGNLDIQTIQSTCSDATICIQEQPRAEDGIVHVECKVEDIPAIFSKLIPQIVDGLAKQGFENTGETQVCFLFYDFVIGSIIGRAGYYIKELMEDSGTFIEAYQECLPGSTERVLLVKGDTDSIIKCLTKLYKELDDKLDLTRPYNRSQYIPEAGFLGVYHNFYHDQTGGFTDISESGLPIRFFIPSKIIGDLDVEKIQSNCPEVSIRIQEKQGAEDGIIHVEYKSNNIRALLSELILQIFDGLKKQRFDNIKEPELCFLFPESVLIDVVTKGTGIYFEVLREQSGPYIVVEGFGKVYKQCFPDSTEMVISVEGDADKIIECLTNICGNPDHKLDPSLSHKQYTPSAEQNITQFLYREQYHHANTETYAGPPGGSSRGRSTSRGRGSG